MGTSHHSPVSECVVSRSNKHQSGPIGKKNYHFSFSWLRTYDEPRLIVLHMNVRSPARSTVAEEGREETAKQNTDEGDTRRRK